MIRFLADENFNARIMRGLRRRVERVDILDVHECHLDQVSDAAILAWAADNDRVVVSHDVNTMVGIALERVKLNLPMAGLVVAGSKVEIGSALDDLAIIATCAEPDELKGQIWYLPL